MVNVDRTEVFYWSTSTRLRFSNCWKSNFINVGSKVSGGVVMLLIRFFWHPPCCGFPHLSIQQLRAIMPHIRPLGHHGRIYLLVVIFSNFRAILTWNQTLMVTMFLQSGNQLSSLLWEKQGKFLTLRANFGKSGSRLEVCPQGKFQTSDTSELKLDIDNKSWFLA